MLAHDSANLLFRVTSFFANIRKSLADIFKNDFVLFVHRAIHPRGEHLAGTIHKADIDLRSTHNKRSVYTYKKTLAVINEANLRIGYEYTIYCNICRNRILAFFLYNSKYTKKRPLHS